MSAGMLAELQARRDAETFTASAGVDDQAFHNQTSDIHMGDAPDEEPVQSAFVDVHDETIAVEDELQDEERDSASGVDTLDDIESDNPERNTPDPLSVYCDLLTDATSVLMKMSINTARDGEEGSDNESDEIDGGHDNTSAVSSAAAPYTAANPSLQEQSPTTSTVVHSTVVDYFSAVEENAHRKAGQGLYRNRINTFDTDLDRQDLGSKDGIGEAFGRWLWNENISANAIDRFMKDDKMKPLTDVLPWTSAADLKKRLSNMGTKLSQKAGKWHYADMNVPSLSEVTNQTKVRLRYRRIEDVIRFFLGHSGFKHDLTFEPYRRWRDEKRNVRIYADLPSADWWWWAQTNIANDSATIVPLILYSDKTQLTDHQGNLTGYPVYMSIGNLPERVRNSRTRPGSLLVAQLPVIKGEKDIRSEVYCMSMRHIFDPMIEASKHGLEIACADGWTRRCHPIIAAMPIDYEEQVLVTGIKSGQQCPICTVLPSERENLMINAPRRTVRSTQDQIKRQRDPKEKIKKDDPRWVHDQDCFMWDHPYVDVHRTMAVDILHQLLKGVMMHTLKWTIALLTDKMDDHDTKVMKELRRLPLNTGRALRKEDIIKAVVDRRFAAVPIFHKMRHFPHFSAIDKWTGEEQESIARSILPALVPLLEELHQAEAIRFIRALVDFIMLAMYKSHDDETLRYLDLALFRMNNYKTAFAAYRPTRRSDKGRKQQERLGTGSYHCDKAAARHDAARKTIQDGDGGDAVGGAVEIEDLGALDGHFNFPKFHAMTHYGEMIKWLGNAAGLGTEALEGMHGPQMMAAFKLTNKREGYQDQMADYSTRRLAMQTEFDPGYEVRPETTAEARERTNAPIPVKVTKEVDVCATFGWAANRHLVNNRWRVQNKHRTLEEIVTALGKDTGGKYLREAVAVFVREQRCRTVDPDRRETNSQWAGRLRMWLHNSLSTTVASRGDPSEDERQYIRCTPSWQRRNNARRDWIWVQDTEPSRRPDADEVPFKGRLPVHLRLILTVEDPGPLETPETHAWPTPTAGEWPRKYQGVFVDVYGPLPSNPRGEADRVHSMTMIKRVPAASVNAKKADPSTWRIGGRRIYPVTSVHHAIHVIPKDEGKREGDSVMYINNTSDFATYNFLFNAEWEAQELRAAYDEQERQTRLQQQK